MSVLNEICARKRIHVESKKSETPVEALKERLQNAEAPRGFINALKNKDAPAIIAEVKKASPSKGIIREDFDPYAIARIYEDSGASCISVLTDEPYFQGHDEYLAQVKDGVNIPVLRKDFIVDEYQIYESRALGADCILLIMAALSDEDARSLYDLSTELGMDVLVEVHDAKELERAAALNPEMIGVNNRNLKTLSVDIQTSHDLVSKMPENCLKIAESGLSLKSDIQELVEAGYHGFLVGESLMRKENIGGALKDLL